MPFRSKQPLPGVHALGPRGEMPKKSASNRSMSSRNPPHWSRCDPESQDAIEVVATIDAIEGIPGWRHRRRGRNCQKVFASVTAPGKRQPIPTMAMGLFMPPHPLRR